MFVGLWQSHKASLGHFPETTGNTSHVLKGRKQKVEEKDIAAGPFLPNNAG